MSTILKALRKLEEERDAQQERALRDQVIASSAGAGKGPRILLLAVAGAAGAVLVMALFFAGSAWFAGDDAAPELVATTAPSPAPQARPDSRRAPAPTSPRRTAALVPGSKTTLRALPQARPTPVEIRSAKPLAPIRVEAPAKPLAPIRVEAPERQVPLPAAAPAPKVAVPTETPAPRRQARAVAPVRTPEPAAVAPQPARVEPAIKSAAKGPARPPGPVASAPPARETVAAKLAPAVPVPSAPVRSEPQRSPVLARAPIPTLVVKRTLWHPAPERRVAVLQVAGRDGPVELREGDALGDVVVQQIELSAVVFLHGGVEIRRRVGSR